MSGVRVKDLPSGCTKRDIKIYFSKPVNGGGPIEKIYYPLSEGHAAVIFRNSDTADKVISCGTHQIQGNGIRVKPIRFPQVFTMLEAKFDPSVAALIQSTEHIKDEIQYNKHVELLYDETSCLTGVRCNWFLLEWVWTYIEHISRQQENAWSHSMPSHHDLNELKNPSQIDKGDPPIRIPTTTKIKKDKTKKESTAEKVKYTSNFEASVIEPKKASRLPTHGQSGKKESAWSHRALSAKISLKERKSLERMTNMNITKGTKSVNDIIILSDKADIQSLEFRYGPLTISVYTGMITLAETDAIVIAANGSLAHFGGVADAIAQAAGKGMQRECDEYVRNYGGVPTTKVMHTSAGGEFSPNVKFIMHAVGPICSFTRPEKDACQLTQTFLNSMKYGNHVLKINSVTMPAISTGVFGCSLEIAVRSFLDAVLLFASEHMSDAVHLRKVNLVNKDGNNTAIAVMQLREVIAQGTEKLVSEAQKQIQNAEEEDGGYALTRVSRQISEQDQVLEFDYIRAYGSTDEDTRRRLTSEDVDMYDITPRTSNISRKYDSLPKSENLASRFPDPVAARPLNEKEKISGTSPGSNKSGPSTSRYLNEEVTLRHECGSARASRGHQLPESQGDVPGRIKH